ncbi:Cof-type HAD-IIB family hydrolase [Heliobacterium gestii]|uniref:Cof-type HAD-IIB family hydrolase n=1 Tax=Heliomicrobium gestii TaxID=2699 RepID=A0A845LAJ8_HELGE|nr:Cof-type HAD-IIB family hydrolase [Heliomicrobium gestii]MBM7867222.1 Cof subfamily protein (haloacid dehalogenase superfamily) [Heliomicrobium gestii]MZP43777.1 Cof-type HAD-IIB family hydrolase [Heliomicrobium gestii]
MSPIRLVAMDMDGTLLDEKRRIPEPVAQRIAELRQAGVIFTIATGRIYRSAMPYAQQLELKAPLITCNGALIRHPENGPILHHRRLDAQQVISLLQWLKGKSSDALRYSFHGDDVFTDRTHEYTASYERALGLSFHFVDDLAAHLAGGPDRHPTMFVLMTDPAATPSMTQEILEHLNGAVAITNSHDYFIEILHPEVSKGAALAQLAASLSIDQSEVMAIGDNHNDLSMIRWAGQGVFVANAPEALHREADYVTRARNSMGVLEALNRLFPPLSHVP